MYSRSASFYVLYVNLKLHVLTSILTCCNDASSVFNLHIVVLLKASDQVQSSVDSVLSLDDAVRYALFQTAHIVTFCQIIRLTLCPSFKNGWISVAQLSCVS